MIYQNCPEDEALKRWQQRDFLQIEREYAKDWRAGLASVDNERYYRPLKRFYEKYPKPRTLPELKQLVDQLMSDGGNQEWVLGFGMELLFIPHEVRAQVKGR